MSTVSVAQLGELPLAELDQGLGRDTVREARRLARVLSRERADDVPELAAGAVVAARRAVDLGERVAGGREVGLEVERVAVGVLGALALAPALADHAEEEVDARVGRRRPRRDLELLDRAVVLAPVGVEPPEEDARRSPRRRARDREAESARRSLLVARRERGLGLGDEVERQDERDAPRGRLVGVVRRGPGLRDAHALGRRRRERLLRLFGLLLGLLLGPVAVRVRFAGGGLLDLDRAGEDREARLALAVVEGLVREDDVEAVLEAPEHLGVPEEERASRGEHVPEARDDALTDLGAEVDDDVPAEDRVPGARRGARVGVLHEVVGVELDRGADGVRHLGAPVGRVEERPEPLRDLAAHVGAVDSTPRAAEGGLDDVGREDVARARLVRREGARDHGDRVGLLARRAARAPDRRRGLALPARGEERRDDLARQHVEGRRVPEEARLPDREDLEELLELVAPEGVLLQVAHVGARVDEVAQGDALEEARRDRAPAVLRNGEAGHALEVLAERLRLERQDGLLRHRGTPSRRPRRSAGSGARSWRRRAPWRRAACRRRRTWPRPGRT